MPRLRTVAPEGRGWTRRRTGRGFTYLDADGARLGAADVERIRALAIPPAWRDVWICPVPNGHIQAVGTDDAGRRQYLYHPVWREQRDRMKFDRVLQAAAELPRVRRRVLTDLRAGEPSRSCALAVSFRLLDLGYFRIGSDTYADANGSFGLTTLRREHVRLSGGALVFSFTGKSGIDHVVSIDDADVLSAIGPMRRRRGGDDRLLCFRDGRRWTCVDADAVNAYLADLFRTDLTAKDFRTWHATVIAAVALAGSEEPADTLRSRRRAVKAAVGEVSEYLGNTPTVAKGSYIDPRVIDLYHAGTVLTLDGARPRSPMARQAAHEKAVLSLLG